MTSSETRFALGAAPVYPDALPAAMPATKVPWPRPSPGELPGRVVSVTCFTTRPPKSARDASIPESTIAIAGGFGSEPFVTLAQPRATPETKRHCCRFDKLERRTGASTVIAL